MAILDLSLWTTPVYLVTGIVVYWVVERGIRYRKARKLIGYGHGRSLMTMYRADRVVSVAISRATQDTDQVVNR